MNDGLPAGVRAKVLAVDLERGRLSLGMKESYFVGEPEDAADKPAFEDEGSDTDLDEELAAAAGLQEVSGESEDEEHSEQGSDEEDEEADLDEALLELPAGKRQRTSDDEPASASSEEGGHVFR